MSDDTKKKEKKTEEKRCEECKKRCEELENQVKRVLADYQNLEKRTIEDRKNWIALANKELLLRLLPVLDTLILASKHFKNNGFELSIKQFQEVLRDEGVIKVETKDKFFDPLAMECVETRKGEDWKVLEEIRSGYKFKDIILRPALVVVGKKGDAETSSA